MDLVGTPQAQAAVTCYKHDYIGNIEYQNNALEAYYTEEGRINYAQGSRTEYNIKDHLGNTRVCFTPPATGNAPKILQQTNYYAFGLPIGNLSRTYPLTNGGAFALEDKYQYNGIELNTDFGLLVNEARYRTLDAQLGRWWQIDPEVEQFEAWSPYNSNLDNPIRYDDKEGDTPGGGDDNIIRYKPPIEGGSGAGGGASNGNIVQTQQAKANYDNKFTSVKVEEPIIITPATKTPSVKNAGKGGVYVLKDPNTGKVERSGRTVNVDRRAKEHANTKETKGLDFEVVHKTDDYKEQRGLEQKVHEEHNPPLNKIEPISAKNKKITDYTNAADSYLQRYTVPTNQQPQ